MPVLEAKNIHKTYVINGKEIHALSDVSFRLAAGEILLITGRSGAGKTTLLNIMAGIERPTEGEIKYDQVIMNHLSQEAMAEWRGKHQGFVFQNGNLLSHLTLEQNVALPLIYSGYDEEDIKIRVNEILNFMGLSDRSGHKPYQMSGGERQRGALARALVSSPLFILADEPTADLDEENASLFYRIAKRLAADSGIGFLIISHDPMASLLGVKPIRLDKGRWVE